MWLLIFSLLFNLTSHPVFADDPSITPTGASPSAAAQTTPQATETPTITPTNTPIPTPTPDPVIALFNQYKTDYLLHRDLYEKAYLEYVDKKQVHTKYGTLITRKDNIEATKNVLAARNEMIRTYLLALRVDLDKYEQNNPTDTEKMQIEIKKWEDWCQEQKIVIQAFNNESDIKKNAEEFKNKYIQIQQVIYTSLVQNEINLRTQTLRKVTSLAESIKTSPRISPESLAWFDSLPVKSDLVQSSLANSITIAQKNQSANKFTNFYPNSKNELNKANNYLLEMSNNLKTIVTKFAN